MRFKVSLKQNSSPEAREAQKFFKELEKSFLPEGALSKLDQLLGAVPDNKISISTSHNPENKTDELSIGASDLYLADVTFGEKEIMGDNNNISKVVLKEKTPSVTVNYSPSSKKGHVYDKGYEELKKHFVKALERHPYLVDMKSGGITKNVVQYDPLKKTFNRLGPILSDKIFAEEIANKANTFECAVL